MSNESEALPNSNLNFIDITTHDITSDGTITVSTLIALSQIETSDIMIKLAKGNAADTLDTGWYSEYNDGAVKYRGCAYDASAGTFVFFNNTTDPSATIGTGYTLLDVTAKDIISTNVTGTLLTAAQPNITAVGTLTNLTTSGEIRSSNGAAFAPSYSFATDTDTGMYNPSLNILAFATNGIERVRMEATGTVSNVPFLSGMSNSAPQYSFEADPDSGFSGDLSGSCYVVSDGKQAASFATGAVTFSTNNAQRMSIAASGVTINSIPMLAADGSTSTPSYSFVNDPNTGMYLSGTDAVGIATGGFARISVSNSSIIAAVPISTSTGSELVPSHTFSSDTNTGMYLSDFDTVGLTTGGVARMLVSNLSITSTVPIIGPSGSSASPTYGFSGDPNTGIYSSGADIINFLAGGVNSVAISQNTLTSNLPIISVTGTATAPSYCFSGDTDTGMYSSPSTDVVGLTTNGVSRLLIDKTSITTTLPIVATGGSYATPTYGFSANLGFRATDANTIEVASSTAGDGSGAYLMRLSAAGGWSQVRNSGSLTKPSTFIDQQYYGGDLTSGYSMVTLGDAWTSIATAWNYIKCWNTGGGASFRVQGNGAVYADNAYSSSGADYAEYFESTDGTAIPTGSTVVLVDGKVRRAIETDPLTSIIGVVRPKNSPDVAAVGNVYEDYWSGKYEKDEFGAPVMEEFTGYSWAVDGKMVSYHSDRVPVDVVVPEDKQVVVSQRQKWAAGYDPAAVYIARSQRTEWHVIGLLGQIPVRTGEPVNGTWKLMGNIGDGTVAKRYLVR